MTSEEGDARGAAPPALPVPGSAALWLCAAALISGVFWFLRQREMLVSLRDVISLPVSTVSCFLWSEN